LIINGEPFIIDTGISTYEKNDRRQYERSTLAHNTVSIDSKNSSEVWSGFRVGRRAQVKILIDTENHWKASHNGFGKQCLHIREYIIDTDFHIHDKIPEGSKGISYIHFAASVSNVKVQKNNIITNLAIIEVEGADKIELADEMASVIYNVFQPIIVVKLYFTKELSYSIKAYNENSLSN
ncbi:MAG: heparinase II/III-family protein, partial [Muribaculaceae bacterium]|nr:heparinase II/III-family protein [Muribaculaceae bacterium]